LPTPSTLVTQGDLSDRSLLPDVADSLSLATRPDVLAAENRVSGAAAERSLAGLRLLPDMSFRLNYEHEGSSETWMPGLALTLPLFDRGQGERAQAQARLNRSRLERDRLRVAARAEYDAARERYASAIAAAAELEARGLPSSARVEGMVEESYRAGKTDLGSLLVLRREALETRREHLDRLLDAALRGIDFALASGQWPKEQQKERN